MQTVSQSEIQTVSELTRSIKTNLETLFRFVKVVGEISNVRRPFSGHLYFTLKDDQAQLKTVLFKTQQRYLDEAVENGKLVVCYGKLTVYEPRGDYQLIVDSLTFQGSGNLQRELDERKRKFAAEGLFDTERKQTIPPYPQRVVVITSPSGAAIQDFLKICRLRSSRATIQIYPVKVQGDGAAEEIATALDRVNSECLADLIVLCRGGGSIEDLWSFNEECVVRAISRSQMPVVTGIGHEIDFTLADFCADLRAPTPTAAAEHIFADTETLRSTIKALSSQMVYALTTTINNYQQRVVYCTRLLGTMGATFEHSTLRLDQLTNNLSRAITARIAKSQLKCDTLTLRIHNQSPAQQLSQKEQQLHHVNSVLHQQMHYILEKKTTALAAQASLLDVVSPLATLGRGYSIVTRKADTKKTKEIITKSSQVKPRDTLEIILHEGKLQCEVTDKSI